MLQTQNLPLPLDVGINTKQDAKLVDMNYGLDVENADYSTIGTLKKRQGFSQIISSSISGDDAQSIHANDKALLLLGEQGSLAEINAINYSSNWTREMAATISVNTEGKRIRYNYSRFPDVAYDSDNDLLICASVDGFVGVDFVDNETGAESSFRLSSPSGGTIVRVKALYNQVQQRALIVAQNDTFDISLHSVDPETGEVSNVSVGTCFSEDNFDGYISGTTLYVYFMSGSANLRWRSYSLSSLTLLTNQAWAVNTANSNASLSAAPTNIGAIVSYSHTNAGTNYVQLVSTSNTTGTVVATLQIGLGTEFLYTSPVSQVSAYDATPGVTWYGVLYTRGSSTVGEHFVTVLDLVTVNNTTGSIVNPASPTAQTFSGVALTSKLFDDWYFTGCIYSQNTEANIYSNNHYLFGLKTTEGFPTLKDKVVLSRFAELQAPGAEGHLTFSKVVEDNAGDKHVVISKMPNLPGLQVANTGVDLITFKFSETNQPCQSVSMGSSIIIGGGYAMEFDGSRLYENGFHYAPQINGVTTSGVGGQIAAGTYSYRIVPVYTDANGQTTYGQPSGIDTRAVGTSLTKITTAGATSTNTINYNGIPYTSKDTVYYELYRTAAGGSTHFYVTTLTASAFAGNTFADTFADSAITSNKALYTESGIIPNDPIKGFKFATVLQNRGVFGGGEDDNAVYFTKQYLFGESPSGSFEFELRFDGGMVGGADPITGIGALDDKLIVFKNSYIFMVQGNYPNELGQAYGLSQPFIVSADTGCANYKTIQYIPQGLLFQSLKGWYVVTPGMQVQFVGEGAEGFANATITGGSVIPGKNQVRYTQLSGNSLVYDFLVSKWSEKTSTGERGVATWNGSQVLLKNQSGAIVAKEESTFQDVSSYYSLKVETSWIKTTGIQDFGRIRNALILGKYKSPHTLTIQVYYDYETSVAETHTYTHDPANAVYQCRVHLQRQKCQSIKFIIFDTPTSGTGEGVELTNLTLELGVRKGTFKVAPSKTV
jgi:hypothetical protein